MNGKDRVTAALNHQKTDRAALAYEATFEVTLSLVKYFGIDKMAHLPVDQVGTFQSPIGEKDVGIDQEIELQKILGVDLAKIACPTNPDNTIGNWFGLPLLQREKDGILVGAWGIRFKEYKYQYGTYIELDGYPLSAAETLDEFVNHPSPSLDLYDYSCLKSIFPKYDGFYRLLNMNGCFDIARYIRGTERFFVDLALEPEKAEVLLDKVNDFAIAYLDRCMDECAGLFDGVYCGDDFGTQKGLAISPAMWRKYVKPRYKKLVDKVHGYGLKYFHHSCGGVRPIIPDLIELGFDVLNPIQPLAAGMEPGELADEYGKMITFYGAIDEQQTLPFGTPDDVRNEVRERLATLGRYGGYIVAPSHGFQPDTPLENILAMYEAVLGYTPHP